MTEVVVILSVAIALIGAIAILSPERLLSWIDAVDITSHIPLVAAARVAMGAAIWVAADSSQHPNVLRILAAMFVIAGLLIFILGRVRLQRIVEWWLTRPPNVIRAWGVVVLGLSLFLFQTLIFN